MEDLCIAWFIKLRMIGINDNTAFIRTCQEGGGVINSRFLEKELTMMRTTTLGGIYQMARDEATKDVTVMLLHPDAALNTRNGDPDLITTVLRSAIYTKRLRPNAWTNSVVKKLNKAGIFTRYSLSDLIVNNTLNLQLQASSERPFHQVSIPFFHIGISQDMLDRKLYLRTHSMSITYVGHLNSYEISMDQFPKRPDLYLHPPPVGSNARGEWKDFPPGGS